jgi:hypothetical protein
VTELDPHALKGEERLFKDHWPQLKRIGLLLPILKRKRIGRFVHLHVEYVVQTLNYERRDRDLLELFDRGRLAFYLRFWRTGYFRNQHRSKGRSTLWTFRRMNRQFRLLRSIRKRGLYSDPERIEGLAWVFCAESVYFRLDGHHRVAVARYLGYQEVPVMAVTPRDLLELPEMPRSLIEYLEGLEEPSYLPEPRT